MKPLVTFSDPEATARALLVAGFTGRGEAYLPDSVTVSFPTATLAGDDTHVQVELESASDQDFPILERAQVRVACYSAPGKRSNAKNLAALAHGLLLAAIDVSPQVGRSALIDDPDTGNVMCWFIVRVNTRATLLAS